MRQHYSDEHHALREAQIQKELAGRTPPKKPEQPPLVNRDLAGKDALQTAIKCLLRGEPYGALKPKQRVALLRSLVDAVTRARRRGSRSGRIYADFAQRKAVDCASTRVEE